MLVICKVFSTLQTSVLWKKLTFVEARQPFAQKPSEHYMPGLL